MPVLEDVYASRMGPEPRIENRQDPVVYSDEPPSAGLTEEQARSFEENGFLFVKSLFSQKEVRAFTRELQRLTSLDEVKRSEEAIREPDSDIVRSIFRVHKHSPVFDRLSRDKRLLDVVRYLLGDEVYIHQSRINLKPGFSGKEFYWHSDFETWHMEDGMPRMRAISASIALTENNEFNGPLMLVPGSHKKYVVCVGETPEDHYKESLRRQETGVPDEESLARLVEEGGIVAPKGPAGSVVFFDCNTMHGSNSNISPYPRSNVFFVYNSITNAVQEPFCGLKPRPEFIATREQIEPLRPATRQLNTIP